MQRVITATLLIGLSTAHGTPEEDSLQAQRMEWTRAYLEQKGGPVPDGGVKVVPAEQMASYKENKAVLLKIKNDMAKFGYVKDRNGEAEQLLNLKITAAHDLNKHKSDYEPRSTHLKQNIDEIKMAYTFLGVPVSDLTESIGYAPAVTYLKKQGWVGAAQFFTKDGIGNCSYSENNVKLSHGAVIIPEELARYDINGKTTTVIVKGTPESGFLYSVEWYDTTFFRELACANKQFSPKITEGLIELAKKIDSN